MKSSSHKNTRTTPRFGGRSYLVNIRELPGAEPLWRNDDWPLLRAHFEWLLPFFRHPNYIKVDNAPLLTIYRMPYIKKSLAASMFKAWRSLAKDHGFKDLHIIQVSQ